MADLDPQRLAAMRRSYERGGLDEADLAPTWLEQLQRWMADAETAGIDELNAIVVATADPEGRPSVRFVLLKGLDEAGLVFYTNYDSAKGRDLAANPYASVLFPWHDLQRQVRVSGRVERVDPETSDAYFASRPYGSRISAAISPQSDVIASREVLERAQEELRAQHPEPDGVPRPADWGGYRVVPETVEFWQGRVDRLHDRLVFRRAGDGAWVVERLAP